MARQDTNNRTATANAVKAQRATFAFMIDYRKIITIEPGKRSGKPCIRNMRITVGDVLGWLAGRSHDEIIGDFPELTTDDILAALAYAADKENNRLLISDAV